MVELTIYPKEGQPFPIRIKRYERHGDQFVLYDETGNVSHDGFLAFQQIAAIVPSQPFKRGHVPQVRDAFDFRVYLRNGERFDINADFCDTSDSETISFAYTNVRPEGPDRYEIEHLYIAPSEVVAIMPPDSLIYRVR